MNIDQQIREILARSYPVNDNLAIPQKPHRNFPQAPARGVSVVGNNNVVVSSDILLLSLFMLLNICGLLCLVH